MTGQRSFPMSLLASGILSVWTLTSCDSDLEVKTKGAAQESSPTTEIETAETPRSDLAAKLRLDDCVDPDLDYIPTKIKLTLCNGVLASGRMQIHECTATGQVGCITTNAHKSISIAEIVPSDIRVGTRIAGVEGIGVLEAHAECTSEGALGCVTTAQFTSVNMTQVVAGNIRSGVTIAGVSGSVVPENHSPCTNDGDFGCVVIGPAFKAMDMSLAVPGHIKSGVVLAGVTGTYPSASTPLVGASATNDLTSLSASTAAGTYEFFDSAGVRHTGSISDAGTITPGAVDQDFSSSLYRQFVVRGDSDLNPNNIKSGVNLFGSVGSLTPAPADCNDNAQTGCVTTAIFTSADLSNLAAENIKTGVALAGVTGAYPSAAHPLAGADATTDLSDFTSATGGSTYEWFNSQGTRFTGVIESDAAITPSTSTQTLNAGLYRSITVQGDANLTGGNIKSGVNIFGVAGSVNPAPANCNTNNQTGCVTTAVFTSADLSNLDAGNIKSGVVIAGTTGAYPSAAHPLAGADGTADLPTFASVSGGASYEWFNSQGDRLTGSIEANETITPSPSAQTLNAGLYRSVTVNGDANLTTPNIKDGVSIFGVSGNVVPSAPACTADGQQGCVTTASFLSADMSNVIPSNVKDNVIIAGVTGSLSGAPVNCSANAEVGCVTTSTYKAANLTNLLSANIKNGVTIAGVAGTYPSLATPLAGATGTSDLTSLAATTPAGSYEFFDSTGTRYTGNISEASGGTITPGTSNQTFNASLYRQFTVTGDADLVAAKIVAGTQIFGVSGTASPAPADCASNAQVGCVTTSTYKAADLTNLVSANIKNGTTVAGVAGSYPSLATPLAGATATTDLTSMAASAAAGSYEFWDSIGTRYIGSITDAGTISPGVNNQTFSTSLYRQFTVSGDADLVAANIKTGAQIFGVNGTTSPAPANCVSDGQTACVATSTYKAADTGAIVANDLKSGKTIAGIAGLLANCSADGGVGCVTTASYKAANMTQVTAGNSKSGVTIGGVVGDFPSATYPLANADATADLDAGSFSAKVKNASAFEYWDSTGARHTGSGDADIIAANIASGTNIFGVSGSVTAETHSNCTSDGGVGCVTTASYKAADMAQVSAGNVRKGVTVAGVLGDYPSTNHRMADNTGTADLDTGTFNAKVKSSSSFEYWDSAGARHTATGDEDIIATNIKSGKSIFGTVGTYTGPLLAPTGFGGNVVSATRIDLTWAAGPFTGYVLVRRVGSAVTWLPTDGSTYPAGSLDADHTAIYVGTSISYSHTGLAAGNTYHYALFGYDANGNYSYAATTSIYIGYRYYRVYFTSVNDDNWLMLSNIDFYMNGTWAAENISSNTNATIGGYSVTISGNVNSSDAYHAIQDNISGNSYSWGTPAGDFSSSSPYNGTAWVKVDFGSPVGINGLKIYGCNSSCGSNENAPDRWRLEDSNDNSNWVTIPGSEITSDVDTWKKYYSYTW